MKEQISRRDWERLSAYVDDQLSASERSRLETRLSSDPTLRKALDDLRMTRSAVKSLPRLRAPRNFTLTPEMAGQQIKTAPRLFSTFRLASIVSTVLLVMVMLGDLIGFGRVGMMPAQEMAAPAAPMEYEAMEQPETAAKEVEAEGTDAEGAISDAEKVDIVEPVAEEAAPEEEMQPQAEAMAEVAPEAEAEAAEEDAAVEAQRDLEEDEAAGVGETHIAEPTSLPASTQVEPTPVPEGGLPDDLAAEPEIPQVVTTPRPLRAIRVVEILLGASAIVFGVAAFFFRRRRR